METTTHRSPPKSSGFASSLVHALPEARFRSPWALGLVLWLGLITPTFGGVRFDVFLGYDGILPEAGWFPVACEVYNDGPSFNAVFELTPAQYNQGQSRIMALELPTGTLKRFVIPVFSSSRFGASWDARLLDEKGRVRAEATAKQARQQTQWDIPLVGAITRTASGLPTLPEIKSRQADLKPGVARLQPALFPDNPLALEGLDTLYLNSEKALDLKLNQVNALLAWLHGGGHLVVGVEQIIHVNGNEWLRQLLPCELASLTSVPAHPELQQWLNSEQHNDGFDSASSAATPPALLMGKKAARLPAGNQANPFANLPADERFEQAALQTAIGSLRDGRVLIGSAVAPLVISARRGRGLLTVLTFSPELEPFLSWKNRAHFWAKMVELPPELFGSEQYNRYGGQSIDGVFGAMIDSKQVRKLPVGWLLLLLVGYLAVIGPLDQYWLRKINKQMLTWLTFPAYVALFSLLIYVIGYKLRAGETEWNELHVVDVTPFGDQADLRGLTYASVYSPVNAKYQLASDQPFATLRGEFLGSYGGGQEVSHTSVEQRGNNFRADIAVPVWTSQLYVSDWLRRGPAPLSLSVTPQGANVLVSVDNRLPAKLTNVKLVFEGQVLELGEVPAGQIRKFDLPRTGSSVQNFVQSRGNQFMSAAQQRQHAFGNNASAQIADLPGSAMAASFISQVQPSSRYGGSYNFITPPRFDLSPLLRRGDAVLLAWVPNHSPVSPINRFSPRRTHRDTLLRIAAPAS